MQDFLIDRPLLRFDNVSDPELFRGQLSAMAFDDTGNLWVATDELAGVSRLESLEPGRYGNHRYFDLSKSLELPDGNDEMDIEGMDWVDGRLWFVGSHTSTRKGFKPGKPDRKNLKRLTKVSRRINRFVLGYATTEGGVPRGNRHMARLPMSKHGNDLSRALKDDPHLGPFLCSTHAGERIQLASKENGFDIEGLAVHAERLFLGLRGPVLRGWSLILEVELEAKKNGALSLARIGPKGKRYRKHFLNLTGMGVRDIKWQGDDLLILAGPTMNITGLQSVYRLRDGIHLEDDSITDLDDRRLALLFHLPVVHNGDKAEGLELYDSLDEPGLMVVYDASRPERKVGTDGVLADVYRFPQGG